MGNKKGIHMQNFDDDELDELYQSLIFEHSKKPYNFKKISHCNCSQIGKNPSCGDKLEIFVNINQNKIQDISFIGEGCALSMASASFLMKKIEHLSLEEAKSIINRFIEFILNKGNLIDSDEPLHIFYNVNKFPLRVKCVLLSWRTMEKILLDTDK